MTKKLKVEVWSDIMCPFCYIGKRHFEQALAQFKYQDKIELEWKSFQLDPTIPEDLPNKPSVYEYLIESKGISEEQSKQMHHQVVQMAQNAGLTYNFDHAVVANSHKAHRLIQMAKSKGLGDVAEEILFKAYFTDGKDFGDLSTLLLLGEEMGLSKEEVNEALSNDAYAYKVAQDIQEAASLGVTGVPFFVFDRKYGVSGAQPVEAFVQTLEKAYEDWPHKELVTVVSKGPSCDTAGDCA